MSAARPAPGIGAGIAAVLTRGAAVVALLGLIAVFSAVSPNFLTLTNVTGILVNSFALQAVVSIAMTLVVAAGGIDLSVGTAVDVASLTLVSLVLAGQSVWTAAVAALLAGGGVGCFNALLIAGFGITPFLATLGTLFIGRSLQQLLTGGGNPIYVAPSAASAGFKFLGHGALLGVPVCLLVVAALAAAVSFLMQATRFGRILLATGVQWSVAWYSGLAVSRNSALTYILSSLVCAFAGILLSTTVSVYVPYSGNAFLLNAIGATFVGTTLHRRGRPNVAGSLLGVLLLGVMANGLLLSGLSFYWQQVGTGALIFVVLAVTFGKRHVFAAASL